MAAEILTESCKDADRREQYQSSNIKWEIVKALRGEHDWLEWKAKMAELRDKKEEMGVVDQLEPMQCVWRWMPVICLENVVSNADVCNGALCWEVHVWLASLAIVLTVQLL